MFGIANQLLAVVALCLITTLLVNTGRARYAPITLLPMLFVTITTGSAGAIMLGRFLKQMNDASLESKLRLAGALNFSLTLFVICCVMFLLLIAVVRWIAVLSGMIALRREPA
jgi:carbon starvation protein